MLKAEVAVDVSGLERLGPEVVAAVRAKVRANTINLQRHVVADKLQGQVLKHRSGALGRSIQTNVTEIPAGATGEVFSSGDVKYAAIHEFGGQTKPHIIEPKKAEALAFLVGGKTVFAKSVNHPGSTIPERSYLRSGLMDMSEEIVASIEAAAAAAARKAMGQ